MKGLDLGFGSGPRASLGAVGFVLLCLRALSYFLDISKAFDRVPHIPLLQHLKDIGLDHHIIQWIASHLLNRKQYVVVGGASSDTSSVVSSVPQGSVLGLLLFITYVYSVNSLMLTKGTQSIYNGWY